MSCKAVPQPGKRLATPGPRRSSSHRAQPSWRGPVRLCVATKAQVLNAIHDPATTIIETRRQHTIVEAGGTVQGAFWLPSTTVYASQGAYRDLIAEAELDRYLQEIGADRAAHLVAT